jgi:hypothetical protein
MLLIVVSSLLSSKVLRRWTTLCASSIDISDRAWIVALSSGAMPGLRFLGASMIAWLLVSCLSVASVGMS